MAWTYTGGVGGGPVDYVRLALGDTDIDDPKLSDAEIQLLLADNSSVVLLAAMDGCRKLVAKYSGLVDETQAGLAESWSQLQKHYRDLEVIIREEMVRKGYADVYVGGQSFQEKMDRELDSDRIQPAFRRSRLTVPLSRDATLPPSFFG